MLDIHGFVVDKKYEKYYIRWLEQYAVNHRGRIWKVLFDVDDKMNVNWTGYYEALCDAPEDEETIDSAVVEQIEKDIRRTVTGGIWSDNEEFRIRLRQVLICYAKHCQTIGYTQSMNYLASGFLATTLVSLTEL